MRTVIDGSGASPDQQLLTLTVPAGVGAGVITVSTAGGQSQLRSGTVQITALPGQTPADAGNTLATAYNPALAINQSLRIDASVATALDVNLYRTDLSAGDQLTLNLENSNSLYDFIRIFDAAGTQLQITQFSPGNTNPPLRWNAPSSGAFYIGISGYANTNYDPNVAGSGDPAGYLGNYTLGIERISVGSSHLGSTSASAASGSAANAGVPAANTGQSITIAGSGLLTGDRVVFTTLDANGNLSETTVTPSAIDLSAQTLSVLVPPAATTGRVRLERDSSGVVLQIVPTLSDVSISGSGFAGNTLQLTGGGFAEGASSVLLGAQTITDIARNYGLDAFTDNTRINLVVPEGAPSGPIRVVTVGGTSAAFGIALDAIAATAASGTPADAGTPSANPGQAITLTGVDLETTTDVVFQVIDASGNIGQQVVRPSAVNAGNTQAQVLVPLNATSGVVRVVGSASALALQVLPTITDVQVESVAADGSSAQLLIAGLGFVEGGSEYVFGSRTVLDSSAGTGPDVFNRSDPVLGNIANGYVRVTVPLSGGVFGAINVKTAGGTSTSSRPA